MLDEIFEDIIEENVAKETEEAKVATKSFLKEVGEMFAAIFKAIGKFFKKLFSKKTK